MTAVILILALLLLIIFAAWRGSAKEKTLRRTGVRAVGTIIANNDQRNRFQLGGNINTPTIYFSTTDGKEIVGKPMSGFISQFEVAVPSEIDIIYDPQNPRQFVVVDQ